MFPPAWDRSSQQRGGEAVTGAGAEAGALDAGLGCEVPVTRQIHLGVRCAITWRPQLAGGTHRLQVLKSGAHKCYHSHSRSHSHIAVV